MTKNDWPKAIVYASTGLHQHAYFHLADNPLMQGPHLCASDAAVVLNVALAPNTVMIQSGKNGSASS